MKLVIETGWPYLCETCELGTHGRGDDRGCQCPCHEPPDPITPDMLDDV